MNPSATRGLCVTSTQIESSYGIRLAVYVHHALTLTWQLPASAEQRNSTLQLWKESVMKVVTITGDFVDTIPESPRTPGKFTGTSRADFMKAVFSLAAPDAYSWEIRQGGVHWASTPLPADVTRMASSKLSHGYRATTKRQERHLQLMARDRKVS